MKLYSFLLYCGLFVYSCTTVKPDAGSNATKKQKDYDPSGEGIFGRKVVYKDVSASKIVVSQSGVAAIKVCINPSGIVTEAEIIEAETTLTDQHAIKKYLSAAKGYRYQLKEKAPEKQCGKITFSIDGAVDRTIK